jgi:hypothetical protein
MSDFNEILLDLLDAHSREVSALKMRIAELEPQAGWRLWGGDGDGRQQWRQIPHAMLVDAKLKSGIVVRNVRADTLCWDITDPDTDQIVAYRLHYSNGETYQ